MLIYVGNNHNIATACAVADKLFKYGLVEYWIQQKSEFTHTNLTPEQIALYIQTYKDRDNCIVRGHRFWYFSKARADFSGNLIRINTRKRHEFASLVGTLVHEKLHWLDRIIQKHTQLGVYFNHGDNSPVNKQNSVQYSIGKRAKQHMLELQYVGGSTPLSALEHLIKEYE